MKKFFFATTAIVALAVGSAGAADLPRPMMKAPPPPPPPACAQFGGVYAGAQVGWASYDYNWSARDAWEEDLPTTVSSSKGGVAGGVTGGYNWQSRCGVFGIEVDYSWSSIENSKSNSNFEEDDNHTISSRLRGFGTLRTRTGVVVDNFLIYVTGGLAWANFQRSWTLNDTEVPAVSETFAYSRTRWGWTAGVGTEWAINNNWSLKSEILYMRFADEERTFTSALADQASQRFDSQDSVWVSRIGINYRWGGAPTPMMAKF